MNPTTQPTLRPYNWFTPKENNPYLMGATRLLTLYRSYLMEDGVVYFAEFPDRRIVHEYLSCDRTEETRQWRSHIKVTLTKRTFDKYLKRFAAFDFERLTKPVDLGPETFILSESSTVISIKAERNQDGKVYFLDVTAKLHLQMTEAETYDEFLKLHFLFLRFNRRRIHFEEARFGGGGEV